MQVRRDRGRALTRAATVTVLLLAMGTACSDSDADTAAKVKSAKTDDESTTTLKNSERPLHDDPTTTEPSGDPVVVQEGKLDLSKSPSAIAYSFQHPLWYFKSLSVDPAATIDTLPVGENLVLSPDSRYGAIAHAGDAVRKARVEIVRTSDGKSVATLDVNTTVADVRFWSPDSTAVLVGGQAGDHTWSWTGLGVDGSTQVLSGNNYGGAAPFWARGATQTKVVDCGNACNAGVQLMTSKGVPVALGSIRNATTGSSTQSGKIDPDTGQITPFAGALGTEVATGMACGRFAVLTAGRNAANDGPAVYLYDSDTEKVTPLSSGFVSKCPVVAPGAVAVAGQVTDQSAHVVDLATGAETEVARDGKPLAFSKDAKQVVVAGRGTFVVAADGSGGKAASIEIETYCDVGDGTVIVASTAATGERELVRYDVASDSAKTLSRGYLDKTCQLSKDGKWILSGETLVDLVGGTSGTIAINHDDVAGPLVFDQPKSSVDVGSV